MTRRLSWLVGVSSVLVLLASSWAVAQGVGAQLTAPKVKQAVGLWLDPAEKQKRIKFAIDQGNYHPLPDDKVFLAPGPIKVTVSRFNPLAMQVVVQVNAVDDPGHATLGKLVESVFATATVIGAKIPETVVKDLSTKALTDNAAMAAFVRSRGLTEVTTESIAAACPEVVTAQGLVEQVARMVADDQWGAKAVGEQLAAWKDAIRIALNDGSGQAAIRAGVTAGNAYMNGRKAALDALGPAIKAIDTALATLKPTDACKREALLVYQQLRLSIAYDRLQAFTRTYDALVEIRKGLDRYTASEYWDFNGKHEQVDFVVKGTVEPTRAKMQQVSVAFQELSYDVDAGTSSITVKKKDVESSTFIVQKYAAWVPEVGAGVTFTRVSRKQYGTGTNADGKTVIAEKDPDTSNIDPSLMVNFLCGFCGFSSLTPMFQVGSSTSKTTPAIFLGGGFRILATAKGDLAIGVGWALAFNKDLKSGVKVNDEIGGTAELEQKLEWKKVNGTYVTLQYKF